MSLYHPPRKDLELSAVLHALSDPQRLRIVCELSRDPEPRPCGSFLLDVSKSTKTHHFRVLREAGVVAQQLIGTSKLTTLRRDDLDARFPGLLDAVLASADAVLASADAMLASAGSLAGAHA
ncbi:MAG: transcriptional regulator [Solirubrobacterales bacterium]|nr:transcriptional regulator [Solirubrobacterales bacterium]